MTDLIQRITDAIFRQEGMAPDYHNPGNLRDAPWFPQDHQGRRVYPDGTLLTYAKGFWVPRSRAEGVAGAAHVVALRIAKGESLATLISAWAPSTDGNNTLVYIANVAQWAAIPDPKAPLWNYIL